jgi:DNA modification methylase
MEAGEVMRAPKLFYRIIQGDCLDVLSTIKTNSVDLILTDPPYNIASNSKLTFRKDRIVTTREAWGTKFQDDFPEKEYARMMLEAAKQGYRILKPNGSFITFINRGRPYYLTPFYRLFTFRNMIIFIKKNPLPHIRKNNYRSGFQQAAWFSKSKYKINFISQREMVNVFHGRNDKKTSHPTEKCEWMIRPLIERHSDRGDVILDPFLGSGTTMKCAQDLGRSCIGVEISPEYCDMARRRCFGRTFLDREVEYRFEKFADLYPAKAGGGRGRETGGKEVKRQDE